MMMHNPPHPGRILRESLQGLAIVKVAEHLGVTRAALSRILNGRAGISAEMSLRLSDALGTSPDLWFKMQSEYDFWQASQKKRRKISPLGRAA
jgi:addiction module HigA family antidote